MLKDLYAIIGLTSDHSQSTKDIKKAVRHALLRCHPDKHGDTKIDEFHDVIEAKDVLLNPTKQKIYNLMNWLYKNIFNDPAKLLKDPNMHFSPKKYFERKNNSIKCTEKKNTYVDFIDHVYKNAIKLADNGFSQDKCMEYVKGMLKQWKAFERYYEIPEKSNQECDQHSCIRHYADEALNIGVRGFYPLCPRQEDSPIVTIIQQYNKSAYPHFFNTAKEVTDKKFTEDNIMDNQQIENSMIAFK